jgi:pimeloyl-ACP methyl ester carboxylesterase
MPMTSMQILNAGAAGAMADAAADVAAAAASSAVHAAQAGIHSLSGHTVTHGDVRIAVATCGSGPVIVLLPSLGRDVEDFFPIAPLLAARGYRAVMPSPRGIGGSVGPLTGITLHDFADDIAAVIAHEGAQPALVAGHAFGNWVARNTAIDHPDRVAAVAVLAAAHKDFPRELRAHIDGAMDVSLERDLRLAHLRAAFFSAGGDPSPWLDGWYPDVARAQRAASAATPVAGWWTAGRVPVLDVQAANDPFAPASGAHLLRDELGADRVTVRVVGPAGHALLPDQPDAVAEALADFADRVLPKNP